MNPMIKITLSAARRIIDWGEKIYREGVGEQTIEDNLGLPGMIDEVPLGTQVSAYLMTVMQFVRMIVGIVEEAISEEMENLGEDVEALNSINTLLDEMDDTLGIERH